MTKKKKSTSSKKKVESDAEDEYNVEEILARKFVGGKEYYLIKWETYDIKDSSWEDAEHVFCADLVKKFELECSKGNSKEKQRKFESQFPFPDVDDSDVSAGGSSDEEQQEEEQDNKSKKKSTSKKDNGSSSKKRKESEGALSPIKKRASTSSSSSSSKIRVEKEEQDQYSTITGKKTSGIKPPTNITSFQEPQVGYNYGDTPEMITGCKLHNNELLCYIKWIGKKDCTYVPSSIVRTTDPQLLITFYESRIQFDKKDKD